MLDIEEYIKNNIKHNKSVINKSYLYSVRSIIIKFLLKSSLFLDYTYPYILSSLILLNSNYFKNNKPFISENDSRFLIEEIYDNRSNYEINTNKDEFVSNKDLIIYSTPWEFINNKYVCNKITFSININYLNNQNIPLILKMNCEELLSYFNLSNVETIYTDNISEEEATITIIYYKIVENREEIVKNNLNTLLFIALNILNGLGINKIDKIIFKSKIKDKLNELDSEPIIYSKDDINRLNDIINNEINNLEFINNKQDKPKLRIK